MTLLAVDTSVAVPLLTKPHTLHHQVAQWATGKDLRLCGHALVETYSTLTRLPPEYRVSAPEAVQVIDCWFAPALTLSPERAASVHRILAERGVQAGAAWDGLVALAAIEHDAVLITRDARALATYDALGANSQLLNFPVR